MVQGGGQNPEILTAHRFYLGLALDGQKDSDAYFLECQVSQGRRM
ncbi:hypothetical protein [Nostoc sp. 'Peltigera malacea cyanobiont' DB3992]|nr:hypothetical protein [Nostoc sp. 'Peltigera malacea cyanobiont' DB3992]